MSSVFSVAFGALSLRQKTSTNGLASKEASYINLRVCFRRLHSAIEFRHRLAHALGQNCLNRRDAFAGHLRRCFPFRAPHRAQNVIREVAPNFLRPHAHAHADEVQCRRRRPPTSFRCACPRCRSRFTRIMPHGNCTSSTSTIRSAGVHSYFSSSIRTATPLRFIIVCGFARITSSPANLPRPT